MEMLSLVVCQSFQMDYMMLHINNSMVWLHRQQFSKTKTEKEKIHNQKFEKLKIKPNIKI